MRHSKISGRLVCLLIFVLLSQAWASEVTFKDVPKTHWAYEAIESLAKTGIVKGFPDNTFRPNLNITREQFAVVLVLALKLPLDNKAPQIFSDVKPNHRSFLYIDAAKSYIPTPSNLQGPFNFNGNKFITREEIAEAVVLASRLNKKQKADVKILTQKFKDYQSISPTFRELVALAVSSGIMSGNANGTFNAKGALTRAELTVVLNKLVQETQTQQTQPTSNVIKPPRTPWTIEFIDFQRPDYKMVKDFPDYNELQSFYGAVASKVYDPNNFYLVMKHSIIEQSGGVFRANIKTVNIYVYEKDLDQFYIGDMMKFYYDRNNKITSYTIEQKAQPHK